MEEIGVGLLSLLMKEVSRRRVQIGTGVETLLPPPTPPERISDHHLSWRTTIRARVHHEHLTSSGPILEDGMNPGNAHTSGFPLQAHLTHLHLPTTCASDHGKHRCEQRSTRG
jgi:hypothetical protein